MDEERLPDEDSSQELVTITTAVTPVIVKAISTNSPELKPQRPASESVLVLAQNPQAKPKVSTQQFQLINTSQPVIVKNTNAIIVQNYNRNIATSQSVIKSTKSEEWRLVWSTSSLSNSLNKVDGDISNDSCSILTTASDNSTDYVMTSAGSSQNNEKTDNIWTDASSKLFDEDSRDSKTEDGSSNASTSQNK